MTARETASVVSRIRRTPQTAVQCAYPATSVLDLMPGALIGLNVGLVAGLLGAYLPDQVKYGPTWRRILLIDLAAAAGAVAGGVGGCVADVNGCLNADPNPEARGSAALAAIGGSVVGLVGGILLTRHFDDDPNAAAPAPADKPERHGVDDAAAAARARRQHDPGDRRVRHVLSARRRDDVRLRSRGCAARPRRARSRAAPTPAPGRRSPCAPPRRAPDPAPAAPPA